MSETGTDIIIKGGSVHLDFDHSLYLPDPIDPQYKRKHSTRKIRRVLVQDENNEPLFDSRDSEEGLKWTITVTTE